MIISFKKGLVAIPLVILVFSLIISLSSSYACRWDPIVNKCHPDNCEVVVYKHSGCNGNLYYAFNGNNQNEWRNLTNLTWPDGTNMNDSISCYVVGCYTSFFYYEHTNFGGKNAKHENPKCDNLMQKDFRNDWWNDKISSLKVFCK
ncbi:MAG: hypothetical protein N3A62_00815 [Thermodesulfovibrionales bacterium]|nr:hypothetical protein [Thermodesulfovibrionales bacterium]